MTGLNQKRPTRSSFLKNSIIGLATITAALSFNEAYAKGGKGQAGRDIDWGFTPNWAINNGYIGNPQFRLRDDYDLANAMDDARQKKRRLRRVREEMRPIERQLDQKQKAGKNLRQEIASLEKEIQQATKKIKKLQTDIANAKAKIPQLQNRLNNMTSQIATLESQKTDKSASLQTKRQQLQTVKQQQNQAAQQLRSFIQTCVAGGATAQECAAKPRAVALKNKVAKLKQKTTNLNSQINTLNREVRALTTQIQTKKREKTKVAANLKNAKDLVANGQTKVAQAKQNKQKKVQQKSQKETRFTNVKNEISRLKNQLSPLVTKEQRIRNRLDQAIREARSIRRNLIDRVIYANREGNRSGAHDGNKVGSSLAYQLGEQSGNYDGQNDGQNQGESEGRRREYNSGYADGSVDGESDANDRGEVDGKALGRNQGNSSAGDTDGTADGIARAEKSDASSVGQQQGMDDGMKRAIADGETIGTPQGEKRAIDRHENKSLKNVTIKGQFAGTFTQGVPAFPGVGSPSVRACDQYFKQIVRMACRDGLVIGYYDSAEQSYHYNVGNAYNQAYTYAHSAAYQSALAQYYTDSFEQGKTNGYDETYAKVYPQVKEQFRRSEKAKFEANPEKNSNEYRTSFASATKSAYASKYEEIRSGSFEFYTNKVYKENIAEQTEKFASIRDGQVSSIYSNHPVLDYVSSSIEDAGVKGVAAKDGIYQPTESIVYDIVVKNYGKTSAKNVVANLSNGEKVTLPAIPAQSVVTVKAGAKTAVKSSLGNVDRSSLVVSRNLSSNDKRIEGRHFYNSATGQLNSKDQKSVKVQYPMIVSSLGVDGEMLLNQEKNVGISIKNNSKRAYNGPITVTLSTSEGKSVITQEFSSIDQIASTVSLSNAKVLISDEADALEYLTFDAEISKNGVTLGTIINAGSKLVKVPFINKDGAPVLLGNSVAETKSLLDMLSDMNGIENVSVLDLSMNQPIMNEADALKDKAIVLSQKGTNQALLSAVSKIAQANTKALITAPVAQSDTLLLLKNSSALNLSATADMKIALLGDMQATVANNFKYKVGNMVLVANDELSTAKAIADALQSDVVADLEKAKSLITEESVLQILKDKTISGEVKNSIQVILAKVMMDILKMDEIYEASSGDGKSLIKKLEKDNSDNLGKALGIIKQGLDAKDASSIIVGIMLLDEIDYALSSHKKMRKVESRIKRSIKKRFSRKVQSKLKRKLRSATSRTFERRFMNSSSGMNTLTGNFNPVKE